MNLRELNLKYKLEDVLPFSEVLKIYSKLTSILDNKYAVEASRTRFEDTVYRELKNATRLEVERSIWIGSRNIDFFILAPCSRGSSRNFKGVAIEVDGKIHNNSVKMKRDNSKYQLLHSLDIALYTIENQDLNSSQFKSFIKDISTLPRLDSRGRKRVKRNICLLTIAKNLENEELLNELNDEKISLLKQIRGLYVN